MSLVCNSVRYLSHTECENLIGVIYCGIQYEFCLRAEKCACIQHIIEHSPDIPIPVYLTLYRLLCASFVYESIGQIPDNSQRHSHK